MSVIKTTMSRLLFKFERGKRNCRKKKRFKFVVKEIKIKKLFEKLGHGGGGMVVVVTVSELHSIIIVCYCVG